MQPAASREVSEELKAAEDGAVPTILGHVEATKGKEGGEMGGEEAQPDAESSGKGRIPGNV